MSFVKILFGLGLLLSACSKKPAAVAPPATPAPAPVVPQPVPAPVLRYLALGDSYTIGQSVGETERFPYLLARQLADSGLQAETPRYIAQTGWTTDELQSAIAAQEPLGTYDFVTLLIGVNDQYRGRDTASYAPRFTQLLQTALRLAGGRSDRVFVLSIPDYSATPFVPAVDKPRVSRAIDDFNAVNRRISLQYNVVYTDITADSRQAASDPSLLAYDNLHYSAAEHRIWAGRLAPKVIPVLR